MSSYRGLNDQEAGMNAEQVCKVCEEEVCDAFTCEMCKDSVCETCTLVCEDCERKTCRDCNGCCNVRNCEHSFCEYCPVRVSLCSCCEEDQVHYEICKDCIMYDPVTLCEKCEGDVNDMLN